jgi:predicted alpha-1,2-mannosidase
MKKRFIIRFLKIFFGILGCLVLAIILFIGGFWWKYRSFVDVARKEIPAAITGEYPLSSKVDPFIGTGGVPWTCAYNFPGVSLPFGMMRLSPETASMLTSDKALNTSGYFYGDDKIVGFSHTRLVGTGATDGGHFLIQPIADQKLPGETPQEVQHKYSHKNELAYPGYYSLELPDKGINVELTGTERAGVHRYTFDDTKNPGILLDISHTLGDKRSEDAYLKILNDQDLEGHIRSFGSFAGRYGGIKVYFAAKFDTPFAKYQIWENDIKSTKNPSNTNEKLISLFRFDEPKIELKIAISHVSVENAWQNLEAEVHDKSFETVSKEALDAWESRLSSIQISGGTMEQQVNFYTTLYRSFQMPTIFNDVNGQYIGFDKAIHQADEFQYFTDMSIWDTFRTAHPLYTLIAPQDQQDMIVSLVQMAKQGGWLPRWPSGNGYTNSMLGSASDIVISEAYQKGICDFDVQFAYDKMKQIALASTPKGSAYSGRDGNDDCVKYGYCPADSMDEAVSRTLEFAWSDYSIALLAKQLGYQEDAQKFHEKSMQYKNVWNPETQFFHPRNANGEFVKDFKPHMLTYVDNKEKYTNDYVEGSAMQWRWAPLFDAPGLINLFESKDYFISELNDFFAKSDPEIGYWYPGSYYWHGNEPDIHAAYLFNYAGRPDLTQKWVRWILDNKYTNRYDGLDGNDDGATLSAWYIFSSLGFYPLAGTDIYLLGAPLFEKATIKIGSANLEIHTLNYAPENKYVKQVWLNGELLDRTWMKHDEISNGGMLKFEMSSTPAI